MNWDRGLKRITLVLSIVGAMVGGGWAFHDAAGGLSYWKSRLSTERQDEYDKAHDDSDLVYEWKKAKTFADQDILWITWTGKMLPTEPWWQNATLLEPDDPNGPKWMRESIRLTPTAEELPRLKELGWVTAKGEPLPETPKGVWYDRHYDKIKDLEGSVTECWIELVGNPILGAILGFGLVWTIYAVSKWGAWPLLIWTTRGFREGEQKDGQQTNKSGPP